MSLEHQKSGAFPAVKSHNPGSVISIDALSWRKIDGVEDAEKSELLFFIRAQVRTLLDSVGGSDTLVTRIVSDNTILKCVVSTHAFDCYIGGAADETVIRWSSVTSVSNDNVRIVVKVCIELLPGNKIRCTQGAEYLPFVRNLLLDVCLTAR